MVLVTWVTCPKCGREWYISAEIEKLGYKPICPFCQTTFKVEEAKRLIRPTGESWAK